MSGQGPADETGAAPRLGSVLLAALLLLPGILPTSAQAENAPEQGVIALKYLDYRDSQPGLQRINVQSPAVYWLAPIGTHWSLEGSAVADSVSGATPRYHSAISGATTYGGMHDERQAFDLKVTNYQERAAYAVGVSQSDEHDYHSSAASIDARFASEDNNRTWNIGIGVARDRIGSSNDPTLSEHRRTHELQLGVTQALTDRDLVQLALTYSRGEGYFSDPYKFPDQRPDVRTQRIALLRWNHYVEPMAAALRTSYRYYSDSFGIQAHTLTAAWAQALGERLTLTPELRLYSQRAASFYYDTVYDAELGEPFPPGFFSNPPQYASADQRLSAFGAISIGLALDWRFADGWQTDVKLTRYEQRASWRWGGGGSPGIDPLRATFLEWGISKRF